MAQLITWLPHHLIHNNVAVEWRQSMAMAAMIVAVDFHFHFFRWRTLNRVSDSNQINHRARAARSLACSPFITISRCIVHKL